MPRLLCCSRQSQSRRRARETITLKEDGPYEQFEEYAAKLKGASFFYSSCRAERGPAYLIVPARSDTNIALIEAYHDGFSSTATVINNAALENSRGEIEVVETEGGIGSRMAVYRIANFLKGRPFYFRATGEIAGLRAPDVSCPDGS